jgi:long-chain acyl-CoA synthetase
MGLYDFTFYDLINRNAAAFGDRPAWLEASDGRTASFRELKQMVDRLACGLQQRGITHGRRIAVLGKNSLEYFLLYGAAAALGAIVLPINWRLSADEVAFNINDGGAVMLMATAEYQPLVDGIREKLETVRDFFDLEPDRGGYEDFNNLLDAGPSPRPVNVSGSDGLVIIHTAAVAGRPRGALLSHTNTICANLCLNLCFSLTPEDVHLNLLPLFHVGGLFMASSSFHAGALNINMQKFDAGAAADLIERHRVSVTFDFSPILSSLLEEHQKSGKDIGSLQSVLGIDTPETIEKYQQVTGGTFYCMYGQTETSALATLGRYDDRPGSAGRTIPLADVRLEGEDGNPVTAGQTGEICVKGPLVFRGYWNLADDTEQAFRLGWHHTGDMGRFDEDGFLWFAGRKPDKELIKPGGENVYPAEVEKVILEHPGVEETVVFGVPDPKWKEGIKAVCRLKPGASLDAEELTRFVGRRIASYKKPQYVAFVAELPRAANGSVERAEVKKLYGGHPLPPSQES